MPRRLALLAAVALATLAAAGPAAAAPTPQQTAAPAPSAVHMLNSSTVFDLQVPGFVLIGANDYGLVAPSA
jgi:hypothetical protein